MNLHYFKLDWLQASNTIRITQGFHGQFQGNAAMDFSSEPLVAPMDGCRIDSSAGTGNQQYFNIHLPIYGAAYIQAVHGRPARLGTFKKGEIMGYCNWHHWHLAINVNGVWQGLLTYIRRDYGLQLIGSPWSNPYDKWGFYGDRTLAVQVSNQVVSTPQPAITNTKPFVPAPMPEVEQPGTDLIESPAAPELQEVVHDDVIIDSVQEIKFVPNPDVVPREDYEQLVNKILDNVEAQKGEKWSWNKFWVGLSKNGFYVQLMGVVLSVVLAYAEQNTGSNGVLIGTTTIAILQALRQALKAKD